MIKPHSDFLRLWHFWESRNSKRIRASVLAAASRFMRGAIRHGCYRLEHVLAAARRISRIDNPREMKERFFTANGLPAESVTTDHKICAAIRRDIDTTPQRAKDWRTL